MPKKYHQENGIKAWVVVFSSALFFFYSFIQLNMFNSLSPALMKAYSVNAVGLGKLSSMFFLANVLFLFPAGLLLDRFSTKKLILLAFFVYLLSTFLFSRTHTLLLAEATRFLMGIASTFCVLSAVRLASRWFLPKRMALVMGLVITFGMLGGVVAQTPLLLLIHHVDWRNAVAACAGFGCVLWVIILLCVKDYPEGMEGLIKEEKAHLQALGFWTSIKYALKNSQNWLAGIYGNLLSLPVMLLGALWGNQYLVRVVGLNNFQASSVCSMIYFGTIVGSPLFGIFSDQLSRRRFPMIVGGAACFCLFLFLQLDAPTHLFGLMCLFFAIGFFSSAQVIPFALLSEANPRHLVGTSEGVGCTIIMSAGLIFQPLFGFLMDLNWQGQMAHGTHVYPLIAYHRAMWIFPVVFLISTFLVLFIRETYCKTQDC
jgi:MFS family permease